MDRWTDGQMDRWTDGQMERKTERGKNKIDIILGGKITRSKHDKERVKLL
jgi:hypothetical protein